MIRRFTLIGVVFTAVFLFAIDAAQAGRLGGAYRGPYGEENTQAEEENSTDVGSPTAESPKAEGGTSGDNSGGGEGAGTGTGTSGGTGEGSGAGEGEGSGGGTSSPPPGTGGGEGEGGEGNEGSGTADAGTGGGGDTSGNSGSSSTPGGASPGPGSSGGNIGGTGGTTGPGGGKTKQIDQKKFWTFWFEHNKEGLLAEMLKARSSQSAMTPGSSTFFFQGNKGGRSLTPVTSEQKMKVIRPVLEKACTHKSDWVRDAAVLALGKLGAEESLPYILGRLKDPKDWVAEDALLALGLTGLQKKAFTPLMKALKTKDPRRKAFAALGLALLGNSAAINRLMPEYKAEIKRNRDDDDLACVLAIAIGHLGEEDQVPDLAMPLKQKGREKLKVHICQALSQIGGDKAKDILMRCFKDRPPVRAAAVLALSNFPDEKVAATLLDKSGIRNADDQVKGFAAVALGRIAAQLPPSSRIRRKIQTALKDEAEGPHKNLYSAMYASLGLAIMGSDASNEYFDEHLSKKLRMKHQDENHSAMAMAAGLLDMSAVAPSLRDIVKKTDMDQDYRGYACFSLGIMGDAKSKQGIKEAMKRDGKRPHLLRSGCWALGLLGDASDVPLLIGYIKNDKKELHEVRGAAAVAIGLIGDASAVDPLIRIAKTDPVSSNRAFAIAALGCLIDKDPVPRMPQLFETINYRERVTVVRDVLTNL